LYLAGLAGGGGFWNAEKGTMKEFVPEEGELVDDAVDEEVGDPTAAAAVGAGAIDAGADEAPAEEGRSPGSAKELEALNDRHLRLVAEFNNFRRRTEQERLSAWTRAQADVVAKFLDVLDDLHRVAQLDLGNATVEAIMEGIDLVERKFTRMLEDSGVEVIDPAGRAFDPESMEAVMRVPAESDDQDDVVAQVFTKGYTLKGVLVRPARVSVFKQG
jgi:molecular chaperone GrpE